MTSRLSDSAALLYLLTPVVEKVKEFGESQARRNRRNELRSMEREAKACLRRYVTIMEERDRLAAAWKHRL